MTVEDVRLVIQAMYLREVIGSWHASLSQFIEGLLTSYAVVGYYCLIFIYFFVVRLIYNT